VEFYGIPIFQWNSNFPVEFLFGDFGLIGIYFGDFGVFFTVIFKKNRDSFCNGRVGVLSYRSKRMLETRISRGKEAVLFLRSLFKVGLFVKSKRNPTPMIFQMFQV